MTFIRKTLGLVLGAAAAFVIALSPASAFAAGTATLAVSPAGGTHTAGSIFNVTISEDSGVNDVDSARAQLTYNAATLQAIGISTSANPFTTCVTPASAAGGAITTGDCTLLGAKKQGKQTLAVVTFKVLVSSGSSSLTFSSASQVVSGGVDLTWTPVNGTYTYAPAPAPAPAPAKTKTNNPTPTTTTPEVQTQPEVKAAESKKDTPKKEVATTVATTKQTNYLPYVLVIAAAAVAIFFGRRQLLARPAQAVATNKKPVKAAAKKKPARRR